MPKSQEIADRQLDSLARELLEFRDEFNALNACNTFVLRALAGALMNEGGTDSRSVTGAMFCAQWLGDRAAELERRLKEIQRRAHHVAQS